MRQRADLSVLSVPRLGEGELARRFALAREPLQGKVRQPHFRRFAGELEWIAEPFRRVRRRIDVAPAETPCTVLVIPGFATHPWRMRYLSQQLERAGHRTKHWGMGFNLGPREDTLDRLEARLRDVRRRYGQPVVLLGWSLGGLFARELAKREPALVRKVITMGSPFSGNPRDNNVWRAYQFITGHRVDDPPIRADLSVKPPVETVAMWSPRDGIISPRSACGRPDERDRAISLRCTHIGFSYDPSVVQAILRELNRG